MGQLLQSGIATSINISRKKGSNFDLLKNEDIIKNELSRFFDLSNYDMDISEDYLKFNLKEEVFNDNIHACVKEFNNLIKCNVFTEDYMEKFNDKSLDSYTKENYPITLKTYDDSYPYKSEYEKEQNYGKKYIEQIPYMDEEYIDNYYSFWLFYGNSDLNSNLIKVVKIIPLWVSFNKYNCEDETALLYMFNIMRKKYFKNTLLKNTIFYIN